MNKILLIISLNLVLTFPISGQTGWNIVNTGTTNNITSMCAVDTNYIFATANPGNILRSTDGGVNWLLIPTGSMITFRSISFVNKDTGYVFGANLIYKTVNSGLNWFVFSTFSTNNNIMFAKYFSRSNGLIISDYSSIYSYEIRCYRTSDGGSNWMYSLVTGGYLSIYNNVSFLDSLNGYIVVVYIMSKTSDGGYSWSTGNISANNIDNWVYNFVNPNTGFIYASGGTVKKTTNKGASFSNIFSNPQFNYYAGYFINDSTGYISTPTGTILCTTNNGSNWITQYSVPMPSSLFYMYFVNPKLGFVFGNNGTMLRTKDGGGLYIGITQLSAEIPGAFLLSQNYPNPFNPSTKIKFDLPSKSNVKIVIYDILGKEISALVNEELNPGTFEVNWDASNYPSGVYFYRLMTVDFTESKKMLFIR